MTGEIIVYIWLGCVVAFVGFMVWWAWGNTRHDRIRPNADTDDHDGDGQ